MTADTQFQPPKKKINILWFIGGFFLLLVGLFFFQLFGPGPRIIVSPQTTRIAEPLGPNGLPDYEAYVLELSRKGVTPQTNAAALFWPALWPGDLKPADYSAVAKELGLEEIPSPEDALVRLYARDTQARIERWLRGRFDVQDAKNSASDNAKPVTPEEIEQGQFDEEAIRAATEELLDEAMERPWTSDEIPPLGRWAKENQAPLDMLVEGSRRPMCYFPSPSLLDGKSESLVSMVLPGVQSIRDGARGLSARAMWHLGEGRNDEAWQDILAIHRMARLTAQGHILIEQLVGIAIDNIACDRAVTLLHHGNLSVEQVKTALRDLNDLTDHAGAADCFDSSERAMFLDAVTRLSTGESEDLFQDSGLSNLFIVAIDWNIVLRKGNDYFDRYSTAARLPTRAARDQALSTLENDIRRLESELRTSGTIVASLFSTSARSNAMAGIMIGLMLPAVNAVMDAQDRANTTLQLTRLAAALAVFRAEHGVYPEKLDDLVPDVLDELPADFYNAKPFIYLRDGEGYLLYSAGENGADDGGSNESMGILKGQSLDFEDPLRETIPEGTDDISIRTPRPAFKMPQVTPPDDEP